jgi:hypothetical protein
MESGSRHKKGKISKIVEKDPEADMAMKKLDP